MPVATTSARARHTGHADLLREAVDGRVGEDPPAGRRPESAGWRPESAGRRSESE
nr:MULTISPECIES: DUF664 domain-containing protein [Kribbella]